jgi:hypothetical protein
MVTAFTKLELRATISPLNESFRLSAAVVVCATTAASNNLCYREKGRETDFAMRKIRTPDVAVYQVKLP